MLEDLGSIVIKCKCCNKRLMDICNITRLGENTPSHFVKATCPFCKDESEWVEIRGVFKFGPIPEVNENREPNRNSTVILKVEKVSDAETIFHIIKRNKDGN